MAKCEICNKDVSFGIQVSHSHRRSNRTWKPNVRKVRAIVNGEHKRIYVCTRCLRSGKVQRGYGSGMAKPVEELEVPVVLEALETVEAAAPVEEQAAPAQEAEVPEQE